jgi:hypothetical protein
VVRSPKKVIATKGRPREMATFAADEDGIFEGRGQAVFGKKTTSTTTSLGSEAGDNTRATTASIQRINPAFQNNDTTLPSLSHSNIVITTGDSLHKTDSSAVNLSIRSNMKHGERRTLRNGRSGSASVVVLKQKRP